MKFTLQHRPKKSGENWINSLINNRLHDQTTHQVPQNENPIPSVIENAKSNHELRVAERKEKGEFNPDNLLKKLKVRNTILDPTEEESEEGLEKEDVKNRYMRKYLKEYFIASVSIFIDLNKSFKLTSNGTVEFVKNEFNAEYIPYEETNPRYHVNKEKIEFTRIKLKEAIRDCLKLDAELITTKIIEKLASEIIDNDSMFDLLAFDMESLKLFLQLFSEEQLPRLDRLINVMFKPEVFNYAEIFKPLNNLLFILEKFPDYKQMIFERIFIEKTHFSKYICNFNQLLKLTDSMSDYRAKILAVLLEDRKQFKKLVPTAHKLLILASRIPGSMKLLKNEFNELVVSNGDLLAFFEKCPEGAIKFMFSAFKDNKFKTKEIIRSNQDLERTLKFLNYHSHLEGSAFVVEALVRYLTEEASFFDWIISKDEYQTIFNLLSKKDREELKASYPIYSPEYKRKGSLSSDGKSERNITTWENLFLLPPKASSSVNTLNEKDELNILDKLNKYRYSHFNGFTHFNLNSNSKEQTHLGKMKPNSGDELSKVIRGTNSKVYENLLPQLLKKRSPEELFYQQVEEGFFKDVSKKELLQQPGQSSEFDQDNDANDKNKFNLQNKNDNNNYNSNDDEEYEIIEKKLKY